MLDDPIVRCMERRGYPPWFFRGAHDDSERDAETYRGKDKDDKQ